MENDTKKLTLKESFSVIVRMWHLIPKYRLRFYVGFLVGSTSTFFFRFLDSYLVEEFTEACVSGNNDMLMKNLEIWGFCGTWIDKEERQESRGLLSQGSFMYLFKIY